MDDDETTEEEDGPVTTEDAETDTDEFEPEEVDTPAETDGGTTEDTEASDGPTLAELVPEAMTVEEAQNENYRWRIMIWGGESAGKSHFAYTMPEPIAYIDTEHKAHDIAHKFPDKDIVIYQPNDFGETLDAVESAIDALDIIREKSGDIGTIVVDSMAVMWEWAQQHYLDIYDPGKDAADYDFKSGFQKGPDQWKSIKKFHNSDLRQTMLDTPYHVLWTATRKEDYEKDTKIGEHAYRAAGEKDNGHKIDQIIELRQNDRGHRIGHLRKSGVIRCQYQNLDYPTFEKHRTTVEEIREAEGKTELNDDVSRVANLSHNVAIIDGGIDEDD